MLADELSTELADIGAIVLGPVGTLKGALEIIGATTHIDGAVLDANLHGEMVFSAADLLLERRVPIVFTTGYDETVMPSRFKDIARCEKPIEMLKVTRALERAIHG